MAYSALLPWGLTVSIAFAIGMATLTPATAMPEVPGSDKLHHLIAFAALTLPLSWWRPRYGWWLLPAAVAYGGVIELIQPHIGRHGEWGDVFANACGALIGWLIGAAARALTRQA
ncbi:MAG: VanZ family protein [Planctomycetota bacterium]|nr:MAG: VanZ family protein [Planctomycetota bacterium]